MRLLLLITLGCAAIVAEEACGADAPHPLAAAERFLTPRGWPAGLPMLKVKYGPAGARRVLNGTSHFTELDWEILEQPPLITWDTHGDKDKYTVLMLDLDAPRPAEGDDDTVSGSSGPFLHWYVLNTRAHMATVGAYAPAPYVGPFNENEVISPVGTHRYVFLLLEQRKPGKLADSFVRRKWDLGGFIAENLERGSLQPTAMNMMYVTGKAIK